MLGLWLFCFRVGLIVFSSQMFERDMCVLFGCRQAGVAEKLLNGTQVGAPFEKVCRKRMTQSVGSHPPAGGKAKANLFDQALNIPRVQTTSANADKHRRLAVVFRLRQPKTSAFLQVRG